MADELISEIISQQAYAQVDKLNKDLDGLVKKFTDAGIAIDAMNKALSDAKGLGATASSISKAKEETDAYVALSKQAVKLESDKKVAMSDAAKQVAILTAELKQLRQENNRNAQETIAAEGSLKQMQVQLAKLSEEYRKLSAAERAAPIGKEMLANIQKLYPEVSKLEQAMGKYGRNVGNYSSATFQLSQVLRELPAFTFSATTGIMALSNNLPMLADAFKQTAAEVGSNTKALGIFAKSLFSFGNLFTLAIGVFTIFSDQILGFFNATEKADKGLQGFAKSLDEASKSAASEIVTMQNLYRVATDVSISMDKRLAAVKRLQESYPDYLGNLSQEAILAGEAQVAYEALTDAMIDKAIFQAFEKDMEPIAQSIIQMVKVRDDLIKQRDSFFGMATSQANQTEDLSNRQERYNKAIDEQNLRIEAAKSEMKGLFESAKEYFNIIDKRKDKDGPVGKKSRDPKQSDFRLIPPNLDPTIEELNNIERYYDRLARERIRIIGEYFNTPEVRQAMENELKMAEVPYIEVKLKPKIDFEAMIAQIEAYSRSTIESINTLNDAMTKREMNKFDLQQKRMEEYYDAEEWRIKSTMAAGKKRDEELMKSQLRREAQQKRIDAERAQAQKRAAMRQKAIDLLGVISNTALAITRALGDSSVSNPYIRIANAIAVGAIGTAQTAALIASPIPEFAKGTENAPEGYAIVGEKGTEMVVEPSGKKWLTPARDTLTYLKKGSKVITNEKLMDMVKNSAYVNIANSNQPVTPDLYGKALVEQFEALTSKVDKLAGVMQDKGMSLQIIGNYDHYLHVRRNIK